MIPRACRPLLVVTLAAICLAAGCGNRSRLAAIAAGIDRRLAGDPVAAATPAVWSDVRQFYVQREGAPAWITPDGVSRQAGAALSLLRTAGAHGLNAADYGESAWAQLVAALDRKADQGQADRAARDAERITQLTELDLRVTASLLALGRDVALGRTKPESVVRGWTARRTPPDLVGALNQALDAGTVGAYLDGVRPRHPEYAALQRALSDLRDQQERGGPAELAAEIAKVTLNLERWRWMPDDFGARHFLVNIPAYRVVARENGTPVLDIRAVVGKPGHETPVFSEEMTTVVFSPYWNIPDSIVTGETAPAVAKDPAYLRRNNIEILRVTKSGATPVDPSDVQWDDEAELKQLAFRQRPGASNALGHVKFLFPNPHNVYLHDTPADALFARTGRAFSHGCIRVEEPTVIAKYVLRDDPAWNEESITNAMHSGVEKHVALKAAIPVHIVYFTSWVDGTGALQSLPDVYGYDARQRGR
jgi:murein L,D-transpeptidase YcbB/YkuD